MIATLLHEREVHKNELDEIRRLIEDEKKKEEKE